MIDSPPPAELDGCRVLAHTSTKPGLFIDELRLNVGGQLLSSAPLLVVGTFGDLQEIVVPSAIQLPIYAIAERRTVARAFGLSMRWIVNVAVKTAPGSLCDRARHSEPYSGRWPR